MIFSFTGVFLIGILNFLCQHVCVCACVVTSTPNGTIELPDESQFSMIPPRIQSPITISDDDSEANEVLLACDCDDHQAAATNVHEQTTLRLDTPDHTQTQLNHSLDLTLESSTRNQNGHPLVTGDNPLNQSENLIPDYSPRNLSRNPQDDSSSSLNQSGNQQYERRPKRQNLSSNDIPRCQSRYIIPTTSSSILETLHPGSNKSARNQSRNATAESSPIKGLNKNLQADSRQTSFNQSNVQMEHSTKTPNETSANSYEKSQSSEEPNQTKQTKGNQELVHLREKTESDKENTERCQCKCPCKDQKTYLRPGRFPAENLSISENNEEIICEECQCTCNCETKTCDKSTGSDRQLEYTRSEQLMKKTMRPSENDEKFNLQECQCICPCKKIIPTPAECLSTCPCKKIQSWDQSMVTPSQLEDTHSTQESNMSSKRHVRFCPVDDTRLCDTLTSSDNNRWFITPEGIMRGLEALRQTFMGKSEDYISIFINKTAENQLCTSNHEDPHLQTNVEHGFPTINPSGSNIHLHNLNKSVSILRRNSRRDYCNCIEGKQEEETVDHHQRDQEVQKPERADRSQSDEMFEVENAAPIPGSSTMLDTIEVADRSSKTVDDAQRIVMKLQKNELAQDSGGGGGGGGGSSCAGACERYYRDKLIATLQILENKEETIRVQGSSLGVAEGRIAELTKRASELRQELDHKAQELSQLRQFAESCRVDKSDVSISAEIKEVEGQRQLVQTLEDNLAVVTELYRECFYDAAKQEELIDMLRKSYLDVRLMEKAKTDKITKLHNIINKQKRSIEQCQDVVMEVESLKSEISSFLNSSNNDSGMWERGSESPDVGEELADILDQLRQLQHMLTTDCTCGLQEENSSLKERNRILEAELEQIRQRNKDLDESLRHILSQQHEKQMKEKERETEEAVKKLAEVENICKERGEACETLKRQLQQAQVLLDDKTAELLEAQKTSAAKDVTIRGLHQNLEQSEKLVQEGLMKLSEVAKSRSELLLKSQATISELEQRLKHSVRRCRELEAGCRERERSTSELQACLEEAHARGARLCEESRRVTAGIRQWMREKKQQTREQQDKIKMQKLRIRELECCVRTRQNNDLTSQSETEPSSSVSQCESGTYRRRLRPTCSSEINAPSGSLAGCVARENETASCSKCVSNRQQESGSEMASCSRAPVPPTRKKRQQSCNDLNCPTSRPSRDRFEPSSHPDVRWTRLYSRLPRQRSPGERAEYRRPRRQVTADELLQRVEHLHTGLVDGQRRWGRHRQ